MLFKKGKPYTDYNIGLLLYVIFGKVLFYYYPSKILEAYINLLVPVSFINSNAILVTSQLITLFDPTIYDKYRLIKEKRKNRKISYGAMLLCHYLIHHVPVIITYKFMEQNNFYMLYGYYTGLLSLSVQLIWFIFSTYDYNCDTIYMPIPKDIKNILWIFNVITHITCGIYPHISLYILGEMTVLFCLSIFKKNYVNLIYHF